MKPNIEEKISRLQQWGRADLVEEWARVYGRPAPKSISPQLMRRAIAWKWQEEIYGGLSPMAQQKLEDLIRRYKRNMDLFDAPRLEIKAGTQFRRLWHGQVHEVTVAADGFIYRGHKYGSLSEIARAITGTQWNGHAFFGLRNKLKNGGK